MPEHAHDHPHDYTPLSPAERDAALAQADMLAAEKGLSFTPQRRAVFELLLSAGRPLGAYSLIEELAKRENRGIAPPTIYRALDFLLELGVVSRLETVNEFVPCSHPAQPHDCIFLICTCCRKVTEVEQDDIHKTLAQLAEQKGFQTGRQVIELQGLCPACC